MFVKVYNSILDGDTVQAINSFLMKIGPVTTFFQSPIYYKSCFDNPTTKPIYFIAYANNEVVGVLLIVRQVHINFPILKFLSSRDLIIGGPLAEFDSFEIIRLLLEDYMKLDRLPIYTEIRNLTDSNSTKNLFIPKNFIFEDHLDILFNLNLSEEYLWKNVNSTRRKQINRAIREGCLFKEDTNIDTLIECYKIIQLVYKRIKLPLPSFTFFKSMLENSNSLYELKIFVVKYNNLVIGCRLCLLSNHTIYDYYAGALDDFYNKYPNDLLPWEIIKWGKQAGFKLFDFGGAGKPNVPYSVRDYKLKFGGNLVNYGRYVKIHNKFLMQVGKLGLKLYKFFKS